MLYLNLGLSYPYHFASILPSQTLFLWIAETLYGFITSTPTRTAIQPFADADLLDNHELAVLDVISTEAAAHQWNRHWQLQWFS
jgi:hypothetical protein